MSNITKKFLPRKSNEHFLDVCYTDHALSEYARCTGCDWTYYPTEYEKKYANPLLDVLSYHHWIYHLEEAA